MHENPPVHAPRLLVAALSGGSGKTMVSLGLTRAFAGRGLKIAPFKKGPDYIDTAWLGLAASGPDKISPGRNLDPFFTPVEGAPANLLTDLFLQPFRGPDAADLAIIEGNRGLFDGRDLSGSCSSAELARALGIPVVLVISASKMTRTAAALVRGCKDFEPGLNLAGVIVNRATRPRHRAIVRQAIEELAGVPVFGVLPRLATPPAQERQSGLVLDVSARNTTMVAEKSIERMAELVEEHIDLDALLQAAQATPDLPNLLNLPDLPDMPDDIDPINSGNCRTTTVRPESAIYIAENFGQGAHPVIGYARDAAFPFGYVENLEALEKAGAVLLPLSVLDPAPWPEMNGLYLGGAFAQEQVPHIAANRNRLRELSALVERGLPVYAEYGGLLCLCAGLRHQGLYYPLAGVLPLEAESRSAPQGLGYIEGTVLRPNPWHRAGSKLRGHEFHYLKFTPSGPDGNEMLRSPLLGLTSGNGLASSEGRTVDGLLHKNTFAGLFHIFAPACPHWAANFVAAARSEKQRNQA